jgi:hypothetical protein
MCRRLLEAAPEDSVSQVLAFTEAQLEQASQERSTKQSMAKHKRPPPPRPRPFDPMGGLRR